MARSISNIRKKRGRGRPKIGSIPVMVRLLPDQAARLDKWCGGQTDRPGRPEAIRRLVEQALTTAASHEPTSKATAGKAAELAAREINQLGDPSVSGDERASRKRRLIAGPKEFRNIRKK
jgi:hypothetical protein